jgi:hypothetical protein
MTPFRSALITTHFRSQQLDSAIRLVIQEDDPTETFDHGIRVNSAFRELREDALGALVLDKVLPCQGEEL